MEERLFNGNGTNKLFIDDFSDLESIEILDSYGNVYETIPSTDYFVNPHNTDVSSSIVLRNRRFPRGNGNIRVNATFSSGTVPIGVKMATTWLVVGYLTQMRVGGHYVGNFSSESIEGYAYRLATGGSGSNSITDVKNNAQLAILDSYRKVRL